MNSINHYLIIESPVPKIFIALTEKEGLSSWWTEVTHRISAVGKIVGFNFKENERNKMGITHLTKS